MTQSVAPALRRGAFYEPNHHLGSDGTACSLQNLSSAKNRSAVDSSTSTHGLALTKNLRTAVLSGKNASDVFYDHFLRPIAPKLYSVYDTVLDNVSKNISQEATPPRYGYVVGIMQALRLQRPAANKADHGDVFPLPMGALRNALASKRREKIDKLVEKSLPNDNDKQRALAIYNADMKGLIRQLVDSVVRNDGNSNDLLEARGSSGGENSGDLPVGTLLDQAEAYCQSVIGGEISDAIFVINAALITNAYLGVLDLIRVRASQNTPLESTGTGLEHAREPDPLRNVSHTVSEAPTDIELELIAPTRVDTLPMPRGVARQWLPPASSSISLLPERRRRDGAAETRAESESAAAAIVDVNGGPPEYRKRRHVEHGSPIKRRKTHTL